MRNQLGVLAGLLTIATAAAVASSGTARADGVTYQGKQISSGVIVINGQAYIPLSDAAKLVGGSAHHGAAGYVISAAGSSVSVPAGGANQLEGHNGSINQWLFTGKWKFEVVSYTTTSSYQSVYASSTTTDTPSGDNDKLVVVNCILKNAKHKVAEPMLRKYNPYNTAVTDDQGGSYPEVDFDFPGSSGYGPTMLPGSTTHFAIVFDVPKSANVQDLIFTLYDMDDTSDMSDYRIHLNP
jgi:hypothetical protein